MFRSCPIIIRELCCSLLKLLYYNIHNLIRFCKQGVVAACHVVWECVVERAVGWVCVVGYVMRDLLLNCILTHVMELKKVLVFNRQKVVPEHRTKESLCV